ncbi:hypothetical protein [Paenibacillus hexagrammi]|uniref:Uncharacterized protein n=1 Tax=Paenibacillus hexagrammi TaxID=2908839 RepID=A0ABY3SKL9_9BACL|nr:hypothetical protein [Paenibacillus sp. YPD9-1]UJF34598.1 hypothetical protein L0M14_05315 [Paenibacillus sp. YPD9-1]
MMTMEMIKEKHQFIVSEKVSMDNANGLLAKMKEKLIAENELTSEEELTFVAYAFKQENMFVLAADRNEGAMSEKA